MGGLAICQQLRIEEHVLCKHPESDAACATSSESRTSWLERLPLTQEAAGSSPVPPARMPTVAIHDQDMVSDSIIGERASVWL